MFLLTSTFVSFLMAIIFTIVAITISNTTVIDIGGISISVNVFTIAVVVDIIHIKSLTLKENKYFCYIANLCLRMKIRFVACIALFRFFTVLIFRYERNYYQKCNDAANFTPYSLFNSMSYHRSDHVKTAT